MLNFIADKQTFASMSVIKLLAQTRARQQRALMKVSIEALKAEKSIRLS